MFTHLRGELKNETQKPKHSKTKGTATELTLGWIVGFPRVLHLRNIPREQNTGLESTHSQTLR